MFEIIVAKHSGFCFGVKRAMNIIEEVARENIGSNVYTLGPIIHNPQTVEKLAKKGISVLKSTSEIKEGVVILRTHGVEREELEKLKKKKNVKIIDATCPFVGRAQDYVIKLHKMNYPVVIIGEKNHPEVLALKSQIKSNVLVLEKYSDIEELKKLKGHTIGIVSQTTQSEEKFKKMVCMMFDYFKEILIYNTICNATYYRQTAAIDLAKEVDMMLIIGGYNSANTKRLYSLSRKIQKRTHHIETESDLQERWFLEVKRIGIAAGASTPDWIIKNVIKKIEKIDKGGTKK